MAQERRICWPNPDATCLEGGCAYCNDNPFRSVTEISRKLDAWGDVQNRGDGKWKTAREAFQYGWSHGWNNAESRDVS